LQTVGIGSDSLSSFQVQSMDSCENGQEESLEGTRVIPGMGKPVVCSLPSTSGPSSFCSFFSSIVH